MDSGGAARPGRTGLAHGKSRPREAIFGVTRGADPWARPRMEQPARLRPARLRPARLGPARLRPARRAACSRWVRWAEIPWSLPNPMGGDS